MAANKKPRKRYKPKPVCKPLNARNAWLSEGDVHAALLAMEGGTVAEEHLAHLVAHADIIRRMYQAGPEHMQAETIIRMVSIVMSRPDKRITQAEELPIRAAIKVTLPALQRAGNMAVLRAAKASLGDLDRNSGAVMVHI